jgi:hypothetical protein
MACSLAVANGVVTLDFEGVGDLKNVGNFYNGGAGPNYGISFVNGLGLVDGDAGGSGNIANEPSPDTVLFFLSGSASTMNVPAGFSTGFSFFYTSNSYSGSVTVYSGLDGTGELLATLDLVGLGDGTGDPSGGTYGNWAAKGATFEGVARSVQFGGVANQIAFDNVTIGSATPGDQEPDINVTDSVNPNDDLLVPFGLVEVGSSSQEETVTVTNSGNADLNVNSVNIGGESQPSNAKECNTVMLTPECLAQQNKSDKVEPKTGVSDFLITSDNCSEQILAPEASCTITVQFAPQSSCHKTAELQIQSNDSDESVVGVRLEGVGKGDSTGNDIQISAIRTKPAGYVYKIINTGDTPKSINEASLFGDDTNVFSINMNPVGYPSPCSALPRMLQPGESCGLSVLFSPESAGTFHTTLGVFSEDECIFVDIERSYGPSIRK